MQWQTIVATTGDIANLINAIIALILVITNRSDGGTPPSGDPAE
ncbi:hypothetical protein [Micromonospora wenchangensis]